MRSKYYEYDGTLSKDFSGYLFNFQDRREDTPLKGTKVNLTGLASIKSECEEHMMCGLPLFDYRYVQNRLQSKFLKRDEPVQIPEPPTTLTKMAKTNINATTVRLEFNVTGPTYLSLFIKPYEDVTISGWSFLSSHLAKPPTAPLPYHIYITHGIDITPLNFYVDLTVRASSSSLTFPLTLNTLHSFICSPVESWRRLWCASATTWSVRTLHSKSWRRGGSKVCFVIPLLLHIGTVACDISTLYILNRTFIKPIHSK